MAWRLPGRRQAIIWINAGILLIGNLGTNFIEILSEMYTFSFKKMQLKMSSVKWQQFCLFLHVLRMMICDPAGLWIYEYAAASKHIYRANSRFVSSQWETSLQSNTVSHWLGANQESALSHIMVVTLLTVKLNTRYGPHSMGDAQGAKNRHISP